MVYRVATEKKEHRDSSMSLILHEICERGKGRKQSQIYRCGSRTLLSDNDVSGKADARQRNNRTRREREGGRGGGSGNGQDTMFVKQIVDQGQGSAVARCRDMG